MTASHAGGIACDIGGYSTLIFHTEQIPRSTAENTEKVLLCVLGIRLGSSSVSNEPVGVGTARMKRVIRRRPPP
jgi:hypothetical protein